MFLSTVKKEMDHRNIKVSDLSKMSGVSRQQLSGWIHKEKHLSEPNLIKVMECLDLTIVKLFK